MNGMPIGHSMSQQNTIINYILHTQTWFKQRMIPCLFILMERRRTKDYGDILKALKRAAARYELILDLELAAIKAFNISRLGFKSEYDDNVEVNLWFGRLFCLAVIPIDCIGEQFEILM
ncbi:unnamed protein product [Brachionus calyciflorus]|uniref:Uncharacterized protein n=1 Tax=Brachionus calyciflorus TaxID=104777 RepID=A0A814J070_9BILA|nr:unnamed protein product [Brachionus calyciflorus]